jgi:hypothetical protein
MTISTTFLTTCPHYASLRIHTHTHTYTHTLTQHVRSADLSAPVDVQSYELCSDMIDVVIDVSCIYGCVTFPTLLCPSFIAHRSSASDEAAAAAAVPGDTQASSIIRLNNGLVLCLKEVTKYAVPMPPSCSRANIVSPYSCSRTGTLHLCASCGKSSLSSRASSSTTSTASARPSRRFAGLPFCSLPNGVSVCVCSCQIFDVRKHPARG